MTNRVITMISGKTIIRALSVCALMILSFHSYASGDTMSVNVTVNSKFELDIDNGFVDFGRMDPGEKKWNYPNPGITITAKTNDNKPWFLKVNDDTEFASGPYTIPNANFSWSGWSDGAGVWYGDANNTMNVTPSLVYASGIGESNNLPNGTVSHMKFSLDVPGNQAPGTYTTIVYFTMTE